jgi:EmrB/QacA subfamily drug resistance transporter
MTTTALSVGDDLEGIDPDDHRRRWAVLATMCLSLVLIVATVSSVNVAIPSLASSSLNPSDTQILWIVDAYALVFAALLLPAGALGDRYGRKGALLIGLVIFASASATCAFMTDATALIACRAVMGVGAALIMPSTLSLLQSVFTRRERPKAIAVWAGFAGAGGAIGPVLGGTLLVHFWYGSVFFVAAPIALIGFVASAVLAPRSKDAHPSPLDPGGAALSITGFSALLFGIIEGPELGWFDPLVVVAFTIAVTGLAGFVLYEQRREHPMLDMRYFQARRFSGGSMGITFTFMVMFSLFFVLTQYLQYVKGYSALSAGVHQLPFAATMITVSPRAPLVAARLGVKSAVGGGMGMLAVGLGLLSLAGRSTSYGFIAVCLVIMAAGVALAMPSLSTGILQSVPLAKAGVGSAVNDTTREVGGAIGIAAIGSVLTSVYRGHVGPALQVLPPELADLANDNVGKALGVARQAAQVIGPDSSAALAGDVQQAFVDGMHVALRVGAVIAAVAAVAVARRLPGKHHEEMQGVYAAH